MSMNATTLPSEDETLRERLRVLLFARVLVVTVFLAGAGAYIPRILVFSDQFAAADRQMQQQAVEVATQHHIAATTKGEAA